MNGTNGSQRRHSVEIPPSHLTANTKQEEKYLLTLSKLRDLKLDDDLVLAIPQILVSGSQSSGKSSVLEALTKIPFPRNEDTCTRFATEVTLRYAEKESWRFALKFDSADKHPVWHRECSDPAKIPLLFKEASSILFPPHSTASGFSKSILRIEAFGPVLHPLQIVDLPGLILNDPDDKTNVEKVRGMVLRYVKDPNSTILAVISATQDLKEHEIISISKEHDPDGLRTLAVFTKPDLATASKADHLVKVIRGEAADSSKYNCHWHVIRNRTENESDSSWEKRNSDEELFFRTGSSPWNNVPVEKRGASSLVERLRKILFREDLTSLLQDRIEGYLKDCTKQLASLGGGNPSDADQAKIYSRSAETLRAKAHDHARGLYGSDVNASGLEAKLSLRARINDKNIVFRNQVLVNGHKWESGFFVVEPNRYMDEGPFPTRVNEPGFPKSEKEEVDWVKKNLKGKAGHLLPLDSDAARISDIFHEISSNWQGLAEAHLKNIHTVCKEYFAVGTLHAFKEAAKTESYEDDNTNIHISSGVRTDLKSRYIEFPNAPEVAERLYKHHIIPRLDVVSTNAGRELDRLNRDRLRPINTLNLRFEMFRKDYREGNKFSQFGADLRATKKFVGEFNAESFAAAGKGAASKDSETIIAEDYLRTAWIFYELQRDTFIDNVLMQGVERHFLDKDNLGRIIPNVNVSDDFTPEAFADLVRPDPEMSKKREKIEIKINKLEEARKLLR